MITRIVVNDNIDGDTLVLIDTENVSNKTFFFIKDDGSRIEIRIKDGMIELTKHPLDLEDIFLSRSLSPRQIIID